MKKVFLTILVSALIVSLSLFAMKDRDDKMTISFMTTPFDGFYQESVSLSPLASLGLPQSNQEQVAQRCKEEPSALSRLADVALSREQKERQETQPLEREIKIPPLSELAPVAVALSKKQTKGKYGRFTCSECGNSILWNGRTLHLMLHTGEQPYRCGYCPNRYRQSSRVKKHIKEQHKPWPETIYIFVPQK